MRPFSSCLLLAVLVPGMAWRTQGAAPPAPARPRVDALGDPLPPQAVARLGTSRVRLGAARQAVALAPDGKRLATWAASAGTMEGGPGGRGRGPRGSRDEAPRTSQAVQVWDAATGKEHRKLESGLGEGVAGVAFAPDRKTLALATSSGGI